MGVNMRVLVLCCLISFVYSANKYSQNVNQKQPVGDASFKKPFRINKLNALWFKARKRLTDVQLEELHAELTVQDQVELDWKRRKSEGLDEDGEQEAAVRAKLMSVLKRYKLDEYMDYPEMNKLPQGRSDRKDLGDNFNPSKLDRKLEKIWKKAQMSGFSGSELEKLKVELMHQQEKMGEYELLRNEISQIPREEGISKNSIHRFKDEEVLHRTKKSELKEKFAEVKDGYENLHGYLERGSEESLTFNDPRVIDLWMLAKKANFSEVELASFKEELTHFEHKLKKHEYLKQELGARSEDRDVHKAVAGSDPETFQKQEKKVQEYERRIKKHHTELKMRVTDAMKLRSEL